MNTLARIVSSALVGSALLNLQACTQHHALKDGPAQNPEFYAQQGLFAGHHTQNIARDSGLSTASFGLADCSHADQRYAPAHYAVSNGLVHFPSPSRQYEGINAPANTPANTAPGFMKTAQLGSSSQLGHSRLKNAQPGHPALASLAQVAESTHRQLRLSPGDMIELVIENGEGFNGRYILDPNGRVGIPYLPALPLAGLDIYQAANKIELALLKAQLFHAATLATSVQVLEWSEIDVMVTGAVFDPGRKRINTRHKLPQNSDKLAAFGDYSSTRLLSEALRAASGIRPDAKLDQVVLLRQGWHLELDMSGVFSGQNVDDIPLIAGDKVVVPSTGCFQRHLARPSQITPKGMRVFMSNLIDSAHSNANAAVGRYSTNLPYGSRLLQAAVSANCMGGKQWTNASRKVLLASTNPLTGQQEVLERSVEALIRDANNDEQNPYLMPNDALVCYDSDLTNIREIARFVMDLINPLKAL